MMRLELYADGACWGNPGPAAIGAIVKDDKQIILATVSEYIGQGTNNQAEYRAVIAGLQTALKLKPHEIRVFLDSELIVKQLSGAYKVKNPLLRPLHQDVVNLLNKFQKYSVSHIRSEENEEAHSLAKVALKTAVKKN
jgi:ribonuclease HI